MNSKWIDTSEIMSQRKEALEKEIVSTLIDKHGKEHAKRIKDGVAQVLQFWGEADGSPAECKEFCLEYFISNPKKLTELFERISEYTEHYFGHASAINLYFDQYIEVKIGKIQPIDRLFNSMDVTKHFSTDAFNLKIAFIVLLNFPSYKLDELITISNALTERQWAEIRLTELFTDRTDPSIKASLSRAYAVANQYINNLHIYLGKIRFSRGRHFFGGKHSKNKSHCHWELIHEIMTQYKMRYGLSRQKMIYDIMLHIIRQTIPVAIINNPKGIWHIENNTVTTVSGVKTLNSEPENNARYQHLLDIFHAERKADPYFEGTLLERSFEDGKEITQKSVETWIIEFLSSSAIKDVAKIMRRRLNRELAPFDIWYDDFHSLTKHEIRQLDRLAKERFPTLQLFSTDIVNILIQLGFPDDLANSISTKIIVESGRGSGHTIDLDHRQGAIYLRGLDYENTTPFQSLQTNMHELGHSVEMALSKQMAKYYTLGSLPNTAFSETFAFLFETQTLRILGFDIQEENQNHLYACARYLRTLELAGAALLEIRIWQAMYKNPSMSAEKLKRTVIQVAIDIWNQFFEPAFKVKDSPILAIYSHIISNPLYMPDYFIGIITHWQIYEYLQDKPLYKEMVRICSIGKLTPQLWMQRAVGADISPKPLIKATELAIQSLKQKKSA